MRETPEAAEFKYPQDGITPAYAGNTKIRTALSATNRGSPPRMRETLITEKLTDDNIGITPAYAGNTSVLEQALQSFQDHPRVCGKHLYVVITTIVCTGSPPRMRETQWIAERKCAMLGITPAYAGNT